MKKNIILNKYYKNLRNNIFNNLEMPEFIEVYTKFKRLKIQYSFLQIANFLENINIPNIDIPFLQFLLKLINFIRWKLYDLFLLFINGKQFNLFGVTIFCGRQGSGKTMGIVEELERIRQAFPSAIICTNIHYINQDMPLIDWRQLLEIRNGTDGVVFVIDEVQNEYDNSKWKDFPEGILSVITQQRKQRIKIYLSSQVYTRVVKQIREQCFDVIECKTFLGRWTRLKCYDAEDYNTIVDNPSPEKKFKLRKKWKRSFIQSNYIRNLYDSYKVVETMKKAEFINRNER